MGNPVTEWRDTEVVVVTQHRHSRLIHNEQEISPDYQQWYIMGDQTSVQDGKKNKAKKTPTENKRLQ